MRRIAFIGALSFLFIGTGLRAENDFWLVPGDGKAQVKVVLGKNAGVRMVDLGEEADEVDDQDVHWTASYRTFGRPQGGYVLTRHLRSLAGNHTKMYIKAFDSSGKVRFALGPTPYLPLAMSTDCSRIALARVHGPKGFDWADVLAFTDANGAIIYQESAPKFETRVRLSSNGDWAAYIVGGDLVIRQFSTAKVYRRSLSEVAIRSGSPMVRSFALITDEGVLKYQFKTVGSYQVQHVESDMWMKSYDPKDGAPGEVPAPALANAAPQANSPTAIGTLIVKGWAKPSGQIAGYNLFISRVSGSSYKQVNQAPITTESYLVRGVEVGRRYFFVLSAVLTGTSAELSRPSPEWSLVVGPGTP